MSNILIAFMLGAGGAAWAYNKMNDKTGGNTTSSAIVAGLCGLVLFLFMLAVLEITGNIISETI